MNWIQKHAAVLSAAAILATSTGAAYAADLGGVRTTVTLWLNGQQTEAQIGQLDDDTWKITEGGEDAKEYSVTAGGAYTMKDGDAGYQLDGQSVADALSDGMNKDDQGRLWLVWQDHKAEITDCFDADGRAHVKLGDRYFDLEKTADGCSWSSSDDPADGTDYTDLN